MSRVGKYPVPVPSGVSVQIAGAEFIAKGKLGESRMPLTDEVETTIEGDKVWVKPKSESKKARMMWGTTRALINNLVKGVNEGFTINLEINGVGYRAAVEGKTLKLQLKYGTNRERALAGVRRISKPGLRVYAKSTALPKVLGGMGIAIISTSRGLLTDKEAKSKSVGGEVLAYVW